MWKWLMGILNSFVVVNGETTVTLGYEGMLIASQLPPPNEESDAFAVPTSAL